MGAFPNDHSALMLDVIKTNKMEESNRIICSDMKFTEDVNDGDYSNRLFLRVVAKGKCFKKINFQYSIFDTCYFRNCVFHSCNFTGCRFTKTNFGGAKFDGCRFDYAVFEGTQVESEILDLNAPGWENLQLKFARTLRTNYQGLGDSEAANKAIALELNATEVHLKKACFSSEAYYRKKYKRCDRARMILKLITFKTLEFIWGNGESIWKLIRTVLFTLAFMAIIDTKYFGDPLNIGDYWASILMMPKVFLGILRPPNYDESYLAFIFFLRVVAFGFFMSIIIKRFNRR